MNWSFGKNIYPCDHGEPVPAKTKPSTRETPPGKRNTREPNTERCLFCEEPAEDGNRLRKCATLQMDSKVRKCAHILRDENLLRKISAGDLIAIDACYHINCLANMYYRANLIMKVSDESESESTKLLKA